MMHMFPTAIVGLVMVGITLPIQILLVFGIWKRMRPLLCVWMVFATLECLGIIFSMILPFVAKKCKYLRISQKILTKFAHEKLNHSLPAQNGIWAIFVA